MMRTAECRKTSEAIAAFIANGTAIPDREREHLRGCGDCGKALHRAEQLMNLLSDAETREPLRSVEVPTAIRTEVARSVDRRKEIRAVTCIAVIGIAAAAWYWVHSSAHLHHPVAVWVIVMVLFTGPLMLIAMTAGVDAVPGRIVKRMPHRQLSGVCQGLAEAWDVPVWILRMGFVALIFLKGAGLALYLLLDLMLPMHPEDRSLLLRFRIARWWRERRAAHA